MAIEPAPVTIVSCGPGALDYLPPIARRAIDAAEVLVGAPRLLALFPEPDVPRLEVDAGISDLLTRLSGYPPATRLVILVTGDAGLYSLARRVVQHFGRDRCHIIPGISSVQLAFARLGLDWSDAQIISAHKATPHSIDQAINLATVPKIAILAGRPQSMVWIAEQCRQEWAARYRIFILENLSLETERIREVSHRTEEWGSCSSQTIVVLVDRNIF